ncbi:MAG: HEAT repeat domain-containing protein [Acidobacteria bacterium]|nr:HEAT repeat domain-containing protein [Acidobacteriota bacterium]
MSDNLENRDASSTAPRPDGRSDASVVTQFFLIPLAVVAGMVGVFLLFSLATRRSPTPEEYLKTLRSGRFNQRWQAAFELSNILKQADSWKKNSRLQKEVVAAFQQSMSNRDEDPRVRRYLALALGNSGSKEAIPPLLLAAEGNDAELRLYALGGLAHLRADESEAIFQRGLADPDPAVRSVCAFGMGALNGRRGNAELADMLKDPVQEVRWNAALALARRGNNAGEGILIQILDRRYLDKFPRLNPADKAELMLNALRGLKYLKADGLDKAIHEIAETDPDPRVRSAAGSWNLADPS